jgi:cell shape-determining protein MreD
MNWKVAVLLFGLWIAQLVSESLSVALQKPQLSIMIVPVGVTVASLTLPFNHGVITSFFLGLIMDAMLGTAMGYHAAAALWLWLTLFLAMRNFSTSSILTVAAYIGVISFAFRLLLPLGSLIERGSFGNFNISQLVFGPIMDVVLGAGLYCILKWQSGTSKAAQSSEILSRRLSRGSSL